MAARKTHTFPTRVRLVRSAQYRQIFESTLRNNDRFFAVMARPNRIGHPRLGLAVSKKFIKKAVRRHRIKRLIRESFRMHQHHLPAVDIVVMCRSAVNITNNQKIFKSLNNHWQRLYLKCEGF